MVLKGKKFLIIGGAGFIGSHTLEKILKEDIKEVIIYDNFSRGKYSNIEKSLKDKRVKVFGDGGDILQPDILNKAMHKVDGVFHFAALWLLHCAKYPKSAFDVNVKGAFNVFNSCVENNINKIVFSSSASVYGDALQAKMKEDHPFNNKNFYGATKIACESLLNSMHYSNKLNFVGLRYMNVYGERQDYKGAYIAVIMKILDNIEKKINPEINGSGKEAFDFVNVKDCARANILAMKSSINNGFFNVCTGKKTSLRDLAKLLLKLSGSNLNIKYLNQSNQNLVKNRIGDPSNAIKKINFKYEIELEKGLKDLINWKKRI